MRRIKSLLNMHSADFRQYTLHNERMVAEYLEKRLGEAPLGKLRIGLAWAPAFALGAIISPTDAVAATSICQIPAADDQWISLPSGVIVKIPSM